MIERQLGAWVAATCLLLGAGSAQTARAQQPPADSKPSDPRPRINLRAQPSAGMAPARVVLTAELVGGADDFQEYYCPTVIWDWGDDTTSESTVDCQPYEAGKSEIRRRFTIEHVFRRSGTYRVYFRLKQRDKPVGAATVNVHVQPGAREFH
jgi:hypothetical protein